MQEQIQQSWQQPLGEIEAERRQSLKESCISVRDQLLSKIPKAIVHFEIREGQPQSQIIDAAVEWSADKIIVGAKSRLGCDRFMIGSVSNAVANHAPCSVEIVRGPASSPEKSSNTKTLKDHQLSETVIGEEHVPALPAPAVPPGLGPSAPPNPGSAPPPVPGRPSPRPKPDQATLSKPGDKPCSEPG